MLQVTNVGLRFGDKELYKDVNLKFTKGNCYGIIGANGAGKTTFLKILAGDIEPNTGSVSITEKERMSVLRQDHFKYDEDTVLDVVMMGHARLYEIMREKDALYMKEDFTEEDGIKAAELEGEFAELDGWDAETNAEKILMGLGIDKDLHYKQMKELEGGEKVKVLLAQALFGKPEILLLDEPTNHLDMTSKEILENAINNYTGTVFYVSHDRYFINQTASRILELTNTKIINYLGNYDYSEEKCEELTKTYAPAIEKEKKVTSTSSGKQDYLERKAEAARTRKLKNDISKVEKEIKEKEDRLNELDELLADPAVSTNSAKLNEISKEQNEISERLDELMDQWEILSDQLD